MKRSAGATASLVAAPVLVLFHLFYQFVVFEDDVISVCNDVVVFFGEIITLGDEVGDRLVLFINSCISVFQTRIQCIHGSLKFPSRPAEGRQERASSSFNWQPEPT